MRLIPATLLASLFSLPQHADAGGRLRLESGPAIDTNVTRVEAEQGEIISSGLIRVVGDLQGGSRASKDVRLWGRYQGGAKRFFDRPEEDVLLQRLAVGGRLRLISNGIISLGGSVSLRDRSTRDPFLPRDYLRIGADLGPDFRLGGWVVGVRGNVERFYFKPSADQSAEGVGGRVSLSRRWSSLRLSLSGATLRRLFQGDRQIASGGTGSVPVVTDVLGEPRSDTFNSASLQLQYVGRWFGQISYTLISNDSNAFGGGFVRHRGDVSVTTSLPWSLVASAALGLQHVRYDDTVALSSANDITVLDDENRSALTFRLFRPVTGPWGVVAHGGVWFSPFASDPTFRRQVVGLGLAYQR